MQLRNLQKRLGQLENALVHLRPCSTEGKGYLDLPALIRKLFALTQDAARIEKRAVIRGDDSTALAAIREVCRIVELIARLGGELDERGTTSILNLNIDSETATRILQIYDKRHRSTEKDEL